MKPSSHSQQHPLENTIKEQVRRVIARLLPPISDAAAETLEILVVPEQAAQLLNSLEDIRQGHLVGVSDAFADLREY